MGHDAFQGRVVALRTMVFAGPTMVFGATMVFAGALMLAAGEAHGQEAPGERALAGRTEASRPAPPVLIAGRAPGSVQVDGHLDDPAWSQAAAATAFIQQRPQEGAPASERTEVRVLVDDDALYVGALLHDRAPDEIVSRLGRRDDPVHADWFYVFVDGHRDRRTAFGFGLSAAGAQRDLRMAEDNREDASWDAVWAGAVQRSAEGWVAEMRIPLSQIRFHVADGDAAWGINFQRVVARRNETSHWAAVPQGTESFVSLFGELHGVGAVQPRTRVEVAPYVVGRLDRRPGDPSDPFHAPSEALGSVGADMRVGLGSALTLSASVNPDFGQVEGDPAVLNLSAFEVFQQERRPFFVEGADIFGLAFPAWPPLFYSRRIGRTPQGPTPAEATYSERPSATTILAAVKLSGRTEDGWSIGLLDALTPAEDARFMDAAGSRGRATVEPQSNYAVARVARELGEGTSGLGVLATAVNRRIDDAALGFLHEAAYSLAFDGYHRFGGAYELEAGLLASHVRGDTMAIRRTQMAPGHYFQRPDATHLSLDPSRTALSGASAHARLARISGSWKWGLTGSATSPGFETSDLGFNPELDHVHSSAWLRYEDYSPGRVFRSWNVGTMQMVNADTDGRLREWTQDLGFNFQLLNYWSGGVWVMRHAGAWAVHHLRGGPALRKPGRWMGSLDVGSDGREAVSGNGFMFWEVEDETDGRLLSVNATVSVRPTERLSLRVGPALSVGRQAWQYVGEREVGSAGIRYLVGGLDQRTLSLTTRLDYTLSAALSLQVYTRPFIATVEYDAFREVADAGATGFSDRFRAYGFTRTKRAGADLLSFDRDGDGATDLEMSDPSFALSSIQMNTVLRWEYRAGSTLYAVWTHDRDVLGRDRYALGDNLQALRTAPANDVFMLKLSYWLGR